MKAIHPHNTLIIKGLEYLADEKNTTKIIEESSFQSEEGELIVELEKFSTTISFQWYPLSLDLEEESIKYRFDIGVALIKDKLGKYEEERDLTSEQSDIVEKFLKDNEHLMIRECITESQWDNLN